MSRTAQTGETLPETAVRNPGTWADTLHRIDENADELRPACLEGDARPNVDWNDVQRVAYEGHYGFCGNPECFRGDWR